MKRIAVLAVLLWIAGIGRGFCDNLICQLEDPKTYLTRLRFQYDFTYQVNEIDAKVAKSFSFFDVSWLSLGLMGSIEIFIHPTENFWGAYPVDNLIGAFGLYSEITNFGLNGFSFFLYPVAHESTHLVDGYIGGANNIASDRVFDSNEYTGFDVKYSLGKLDLYTGFIWYLYLGSKTTNSIARPLIYRVHVGEDYVLPIIKDVLNFQLSGDVALFYENYYHAAFNVGIGVDLIRVKILAHYETQYGLGQDFRTLQNRLGVEFIFM